VETALYHLLAPQGRGFLPPQRALPEAFRRIKKDDFPPLQTWQTDGDEITGTADW
jgi:hypothetical protein